MSENGPEMMKIAKCSSSRQNHDGTGMLTKQVADFEVFHDLLWL